MGVVNTMIASAAVVALVACKPTIGDAPGLEGGTETPDGAPDVLDVDAALPSDAAPEVPPVDGGATNVTLSQTESEEIVASLSIACSVRDDNGQAIRNLENSYYRVFPLEEKGGDLTVSSVRIGVESAATPDGSAQLGTLRLHTLDGELLRQNMTELVSAQVAIAPQTQSTIDVPIVAAVPIGSTLVVELLIPEAASDGTLFFIGSNSLPETAPGYLRAPSSGCDLQEPTRFADVGIGFPDVHLVMSVTGSY